MIFRNALIGHFDIWNSFSKRRWWFWHFSKGYPLEISPKWTEKKISEYQKSDLVSQNGRLIPIRFTQETMWSLSKKSHNNCLDLVDSIINTLYTTYYKHTHGLIGKNISRVNVFYFYKVETFVTNLICKNKTCKNFDKRSFLLDQKKPNGWNSNHIFCK